jgi:hypothetical protein
MFDAYRSARILRFHDECLALPDWPGGAGAESDARARIPLQGDPADAWRWILANHTFNGSLWNEEDLARRTQAADAEIALNKRHIDRFNQQRNDAIERIDDALLMSVESAGVRRDPAARLSSETAGAMVDRLSILGLKIHHMGLQTRRTDVDESHRETCRAKLAQLLTQRADLAACYDRLLDEVVVGTAYFKIYRQFKMYNDPDLNPALVAERQRRGG